MGRTFEEIDPDLAGWIESQPMFFVSTAPSGNGGHINVSPKGGTGLFKVLGPRTFAYLDLVGSGAETIAHVRENGRIVAMFCAFQGPPKVIRLHGRGRVTELGDEEFESKLRQIGPPDDYLLLARSVVEIEVERIADSCGFMVPQLSLDRERQQLMRWAENQQQRIGPDWKASYLQANNRQSIDGLPAMELADIENAHDLARFSSEGRAL